MPRIDDYLEKDSAPYLVNQIKKNCRMCMAYRNFQPMGKQKPIVMECLNKLYSHYLDELKQLRGDHNATGEQVQESARKKRFVLDLIDSCNSCRKEGNTVGEQIKALK